MNLSICSNCGEASEENLALCPRCGARKKKKTPGETLALLGAILSFVVLGIPLGCFGACVLLFSGLGMATSLDRQNTLLGLGCIAGCVFFGMLLGFVLKHQRK